jgi:large subunit ribosomal protein L25
MLTLKAKIRETKKIEEIRAAGRLPGVIYGHGVENQSIDLNYQDIRKLLDKVGESTLIELDIEGQKPAIVLFHDIQYNPVSSEIAHVDFYQIKEGEKINVSIECNFIGEAPAMKELKGILVKPHDKVEVRCLPKDLIASIDVDIANLKTFDDVIRVSDLSFPASFEIADSEMVVALVAPPRVEEPVEVVETADAPVTEAEDKKEKNKDDEADKSKK